MLALTIVVCSRLILLLGSVFEYLGELVVVKHPVLDGRLPVHLVHLVVSEPVPDGCEELPQSVLVDEADVVLVETTKGILDDVLWVSSLERSGAVIISGQTSTVLNQTWSLSPNMVRNMVKLMGPGASPIMPSR